MQSLHLNTGLKQAACDADPTSMLYLQGPEETEVQLTINSTDIRFGSTILVRILPPGNIMQMISLSGIGILNKGAQDERAVPRALLPKYVYQNHLTRAPERLERIVVGLYLAYYRSMSLKRFTERWTARYQKICNTTAHMCHVWCAHRVSVRFVAVYGWFMKF